MSASGEYVPSIAEVRTAYFVHRGFRGMAVEVTKLSAEFERFMNAHAEEKWQMGWNQGFRDTQAGEVEDGYLAITPTPNPFALTQTGVTDGPQ